MRSPLAMIAALGVTQIIGYGSLYYAFPIMAPAVAQEFGVSEPLLFGLLSAGLLLGGLAAPRLGGLLDRMGAPRVMAAGSLLMAGLSAALALAPSLPVYGALLLLIRFVQATWRIWQGRDESLIVSHEAEDDVRDVAHLNRED